MPPAKTTIKNRTAKTAKPAKTGTTTPRAKRPEPATGTELRKLAKGELRADVLTYINEHPKQDHSPYQVAQGLGGRSAGAVGLALDRLVALGEARQTSEAPRRYQAVSATGATKRRNK